MFRNLWLSDVRYRILDLGAHIAVGLGLAWFMPWLPWWMQFAPDVCLLVLWPHGVLTNSFVTPSSPFMPVLLVHGFLHSYAGIVALSFVAAVVEYGVTGNWRYSAAGYVHCLAHMLIDVHTHDNWKRSIPV